MNIYATLLALVLAVGFSSAFAQESIEGEMEEWDTEYVEEMEAFERETENDLAILDAMEE